MKYLYLIRHAKSSWKDLSLSDYERPLNGRGKRDVVVMAERLKERQISFDLLISSPAKRARVTARKIAKIIGYPKKEIVYTRDLYLTSVDNYRDLINDYFLQVDSLAIVGHNEVITEFAELFTGENIDNVPTSGIVAIELKRDFEFVKGSVAKMQFFDFPKNNIISK